METMGVPNLDQSPYHLYDFSFQAIQLPLALAVIHCKAHKKMTPGSQKVTNTWVTTQSAPTHTFLPTLKVGVRTSYQNFLEEGEAETWQEKFETSFEDGFWRVPDNRPIAPHRLLWLHVPATAFKGPLWNTGHGRYHQVSLYAQGA